MSRKTTHPRQSGSLLVSAISVVMSFALFVSVAWVGWQSLDGAGSQSLYVSMPA